MNYEFAERIDKTPRSFVSEILKVSERPDIISFAGGLPRHHTFLVDEIKKSS